MSHRHLEAESRLVDPSDIRFNWAVADFSGPRVAVATTENQIEIWDIRARRFINRLTHAVYEGGAPRFAIDPSGKVCVTGGYHRGGVGCYRIEDGTELWRRKSLLHCQSIAIAPDAPIVYCAGDKKAAHLLDLRTGETLQTIQGTHSVWCSPFTKHRLFVGTYAYEMVDNRHRPLGVIEPSADRCGSMFDVVFTPSSMVLAECTQSGVIRCFSLRTRRETWRALPPAGCFGPKDLGYCPAREIFYCVIDSTKSRVVPNLAEIELATGTIRVRSSVSRSGGAAFCLKGTVVLVGSGDVHSTATGRLLGRLTQLDN